MNTTTKNDSTAVKQLIVVNDQPYGSERPFNALRLAGALCKREEVDLRVFLMGDGVACAVAARRSTLEELVDWTLWADQVIVF